jgi:hypothetical protein
MYPLYLRNETDLVMVYDLFDLLLKSVCQYFLKIFAFILIKHIGL